MKRIVIWLTALSLIAITSAFGIVWYLRLQQTNLAAISTSSFSVATSTTSTQKQTWNLAQPATRLTTQKGWKVGILAEDLGNPRMMAIDSDNNLYIPDRKDGIIYKLQDTNFDGVTDVRQTIATGLFQPNNVFIHEQSLYIGVNDGVVRIDMDGKKEQVVRDLPATGGHTSKTVIIGPDQKLYISVGSATNNSPEEDPRRAAILRYNLDGTIPDDNPFFSSSDERRRTVWAEGLRNSVGIMFTQNGKLWANHNGMDRLGDDIPPEEIVIEIQKGKHYGWPYCYSPGMGAASSTTPEVSDPRVPISGAPFASCSEVPPALFTDLAHQAPIQMIQIDNQNFAREWQDDLLVAYKGSWNSDVPRDCKVQRILVENGRPIASEDFLNGFRGTPLQECEDAYGRPAGVVVGKHGEVYVADDKAGRIFVVVPD